MVNVEDIMLSEISQPQKKTYSLRFYLHEVSKVVKLRDFPGGPMAKVLCYQCRVPGMDPCSGNLILHATTKSSLAATKDPVCHN